jgi:hypothetical protein
MNGNCTGWPAMAALTNVLGEARQMGRVLAAATKPLDLGDFTFNLRGLHR